MALPTNGRVIIDTTVGELDIELWSKEAPKACRNFIALALEGYYDGVIFHRVVRDFLVQTGDRTGTGGGGESFYGEPYEDEIHPRLRYTHRGLVGCANNGAKNSNDSQFFITLDRADELHGKHTLFGRCIGDTIYNVLKINSMELDGNEKPLYPPKIKTVRILDNPFPDIVPRITAEEKRAQQRAREAAQKEREQEMRLRGAKKDVKLLSFGDDEEEAEPVVTKKKAIVRPDLLQADAPLSISDIPSSSHKSKSKPPTTTAEKEKQPEPSGDIDITKIREKHAQEQAAKENSRKSQIEKMEADIRKLAKRQGAGGDDSDDEPVKKKTKNKSYLEEELAKYTKGRGQKKKDGRRKDEDDVLAALNSFRSKLQSSRAGDDDDDMQPASPGGDDGNEGGGAAPANADDPGVEVDTDVGFLGHALHFPKGNEEEVEKAERDYEVIDPRARGARAREEERERKQKANKGRSGGGGGRSHRR